MKAPQGKIVKEVLADKQGAYQLSCFIGRGSRSGTITTSDGSVYKISACQTVREEPRLKKEPKGFIRDVADELFVLLFFACIFSVLFLFGMVVDFIKYISG